MSLVGTRPILQDELRQYIKMKDAIRQRAFDRFLENFLKDKVSAPYIGFEALRAGSKNYDVVVAGGDQLWIPAGLPTNFFNLMFADEKVKRVSYSTSFGVTEVPFYQKRRTIEYGRVFRCYCSVYTAGILYKYAFIESGLSYKK